MAKRNSRLASPMSQERGARLGLVGLVTFVAILLSSWYVIQLRQSLVVGGSGRFNILYGTAEGDIAFLSVDSVENSIESIDLPEDLYIKSRSVGEYRVGQLYTLGSFEDDAGEFMRRKLQGFLRVPVSGYVLVEGSPDSVKRGLSGGLLHKLWFGSGSNVSRLDAIKLVKQIESYVWYTTETEDLIRAGVLVSRDGGGYSYNVDRLNEYVGDRYFDWLVAEERLSVTVINKSGDPGLARDVADFLNNLGMDVVSVKGSEEDELEIGVVRVSSENVEKSSTVDSLVQLLPIEGVSVGNTEEYRSDIVVIMGKDMRAIF